MPAKRTIRAKSVAVINPPNLAKSLSNNSQLNDGDFFQICSRISEIHNVMIYFILAAKRKSRTMSLSYDRNVRINRRKFIDPSTSQNSVFLPQTALDASLDGSPLRRSSRISHGLTKSTLNNSQLNDGKFCSNL